MKWQHALFLLALAVELPVIGLGYRRIFQELRRRDWRTGAPRP